MTKAQEQVLAAYIATGRLAFFRPRKGEISLNGGKALPVRDAIAKMKEALDRA